MTGEAATRRRDCARRTGFSGWKARPVTDGKYGTKQVNEGWSSGSVTTDEGNTRQNSNNSDVTF